MEDLVTPAEAARMRGVTRSAITDLMKRGRLQTVEVGGRRFLYRTEVEGFAPEITGRPPKPSATEKAATGRASANGDQPARATKQGNKKKGKR